MSPTKAPETREEFEAVLKDPEQIKNLMESDKFGDFVTDYAKAWNDHNVDIQQRVEAEVQKGLAAFLKDNGQPQNKLDLSLTQAGSDKAISRGKGTVYNKAAPGAKIDDSEQKPDSVAEFLQAIWYNAGQLPNAETLYNKVGEWRKIQNSFGSTVPADGGFLIPEQMRSDLLQLALEDTVVRQRATVIPMSTLGMTLPMVDDKSHASSVFGGITAFWTEEGATSTESQAKFGRVRLTAKKLTILLEAPNELIADAPAFGGFIDQTMPPALAFFEDDGFINGSGVGEPKGFINGDATISVTRNTANEIRFEDIVGMYARMLPQSLGKAVWIISPAVLPQLLSLIRIVENQAGTENVGAASPSLWLTGGQLFGGPTMSLLGRPVIVSEKVPDLGSAGDINFVDLGFYLIGDRQVAQASSSMHQKFSSDVTVYKIVERVDGRPWLTSALTPKNGGDTLSPFVNLAA